MLYSIKKETGYERPKDKSTNTKNYEIIPPLSPLPHPDINQPPPYLFHPPIIHNNNTMDTEFVVQMRQSNKCGSVRNDGTFNLPWCRPLIKPTTTKNVQSFQKYYIT